MAALVEPKPDDFPNIYENFFGRMALKVDPHIEAHPIGVMASLLSLASSSIGGRHQITTIKGSLSLHIWTILCGISGGGGKGDATKIARSIFDTALPGWSKFHQKDGFDTGLGIVTYLGDHREDSGLPMNLLIFEAELSRTIEKMGNDNRMISTFTKLFDRDTLTYFTGKDRIEIPDPYVTILAHVQPNLFAKTKKSKATAIGAWNRFLFLRVDQSKTLDLFGPLEEKKYTVAACGLELFKTWTWVNGRKSGDVGISHAARKALASHHRPTVLALTRQSTEVIQYCQRGDAYLLKLAALYAIFDQRNQIEIEDLDSALALIQYSVASVKYALSDEATFTGRTELADKVLAFIVENSGKGPITFSYMTQRIGRNKGSANSINDAFLSALYELGGKVVLYTLPRKPGQRGGSGGKKYFGRYLSTPEGLPKDAIPLTISEVDPWDLDTEGANHDAYRIDDPGEYYAEQVYDDDQGNDTDISDAELVDDEPPAATQPLKALPGPKPSKTTHRPTAGATAPHRPTRPQHGQEEGGGKPKRRGKPAPVEPAVKWW